MGRQTKTRPALVILDTGDADLVVARVTTQAVSAAQDVPITDWQGAGLLAAPIVRHAVGAERHAVDSTSQRDDHEQLAGLDVPETDGLVTGARGQQLAVGAEGPPPDLLGVPAQDGDRGAGGDVPDSDGPVLSGGGEQAAVGMKSHI